MGIESPKISEKIISLTNYTLIPPAFDNLFHDKPRFFDYNIKIVVNV